MGAFLSYWWQVVSRAGEDTRQVAGWRMGLPTLAFNFVVAVIALNFYHGLQGNMGAMQQLDWLVSLAFALLGAVPITFLLFFILAPSRLAADDARLIGALQNELDEYRHSVVLTVNVGQTPQLEKVISTKPVARLMRIGIRNPGQSLVGRAVVQVEEIADLENIWPVGSAINLPYTLRQSRDHESLERARSSGFGFGSLLASRNTTTVVTHRDLATSFLLDGHATEYLDVARAEDDSDSIIIYSTEAHGVLLRPSSLYEFTLFIHGDGVVSRRVALVCEKRAGRWQLRVLD